MPKWLVHIKCPYHSIPPTTKQFVKKEDGTWRRTTKEERVWQKTHFIITEADDAVKAKEKFVEKLYACPHGVGGHTFYIKPEHIIEVMPYPTSEMQKLLRSRTKKGVPGVISFGVLEKTPKQPDYGVSKDVSIIRAERVGVVDSVTKMGSQHEVRQQKFVKAEDSPENVLFINLRSGVETAPTIIDSQTVYTYDKLMAMAKRYGSFDIKTAILAFITAYGHGHKSLITGVLQASGFPNVTTETVGQALARFHSQGVLYKSTRSTQRVRTPPPHTYKSSRKIVTPTYVIPDDPLLISVFKEPVYYVFSAQRNRILSMLDGNPFKWWELLEKPISDTLILRIHVKYSLGYDWVTTVKNTPPFTTLEDYKNYTSKPKGALLKLPAISAYMLVKSGYAEYTFSKNQVNNYKDKTDSIEALFNKFKIDTTKVAIKMGLGFFWGG